MCSLPPLRTVDPEEGAGCDHALASERGSALEMCDSMRPTLGCNQLFPRTGGVAALAVGQGWSHAIACRMRDAGGITKTDERMGT